MFSITDPERGLQASVDWLADAHARSAHLWLVLRATALSDPTIAEELETLLAFKRESWQHTVQWMVSLGILPGYRPGKRMRALAAAYNVISSAETYLPLREDWQMTDADYRTWLRRATTQADTLAGHSHPST